MKPRVAFINISQSPRDDVVPELLDESGVDVEVHEFGALDGHTQEQIEALAPADEGYRLVSRLRDGREVLLSRDWVAKRLQELLDHVDAEGYDLAVLLCTGSFPELHCRTLLVEAGRVVDAMVDALAEGRRRIGVLVPDKSQAQHWSGAAAGGAPCVASFASPYTDLRFREAADEVADAEFIVMHCMGYNRAMRREVAEHSGKPVLLSRSVVAGTLRQLT